MGLCTTEIVRILQIIFETGVEDKSLCMMGKQAIHIEWDSFMKIVKSYGFRYDETMYKKINGIMPIDSYKFFKMFGISEVHALDVSKHEGADIICDLNKELPKNLYQQFDFIVNGGTLEHVFDVAKAMTNMSNMVKESGMIIHLAPLAGYVDHGFYSISPTFFLDYYSENNFAIKNLDMEFLLDKDIPSKWDSIFQKIAACLRIGHR